MNDLQKKIIELKNKKKAILIVHYYQLPEIQEIADFLGDSLGLAKKAATTDAAMIVFCGVKFMAETAKILSPTKKVLLPAIDAGCPMANMVTAEDVLEMKKKYPKAKVVAYVNTNADVKAVTDVCCTSSNAVEVVKNIDSEQIIFVPDQNLASWVQRFVDKEVIPWQGYCYVHHQITLEQVQNAKELIPDAELIVHPECRKEVADFADQVGSTGQMLDFVKKSNKNKFIIGTEIGMIERLQFLYPEKEFYSAGTVRICQNMKKITLENIYRALKDDQFQIELADDIMKNAKKSLDEMLKYS